MCGIAGIIDPHLDHDALRQKARRMLQTLVHRGPDEGGQWFEERYNLALLHRRLAIQDLSASGAQPMHSASSRYCIVFNGEIYNFREIAARLAKSGVVFRGHSDTEVMLAAIEQWGLDEAVQAFSGMFAFALYDRQQQRLTLCRDRLGEKPLYYGWLAGRFCFASELQAIEAVVEPSQLCIDDEALAAYLRNGYVPAPYAIYRHVHKLPPGCMLHLSLTQGEAAARPADFSPQADRPPASPVSYWRLEAVAAQGLAHRFDDPQAAVAALDETLHQSIRRQLIADVRVGAFLSGGIDSSVVSAIAQQESAGAIRTYTIGFSDREYDESAYAEKIARHIGSEHLNMRVDSRDVLDVVPELPRIYDEPFADSSQIPAFLVSRLAREHVTVCLSGDGGDELFAGYNRYLWTRSLWRKMARLPSPLRHLAGRLLALPSPRSWDRLYALLGSSGAYNRQKLVGLKVQKLAGFMRHDDIFSAYEYLMSYWQQPASLLVAAPSAAPGYAGQRLGGVDDFIDQAMYLDQRIYLPGDNLAKVDRASMAVSLETRLPLLTHEMVALAWRIPVAMKVRQNVSKWALRQVLYRYVPQDLIDRPKMGFSVPVASWLRGDLKQWAGDLIASIDSASRLRKPVIERAWREHCAGSMDHSHRLWTVLMYLAWRQHRQSPPE